MLLVAAVAVALQPAALVGAPLDRHVLGTAHCITLGFVAVVAVGALHAALPLALRGALPATWLDWTLLVCLLLTALGVASHLWLQSYPGIVWSAGLLVLVLLLQLPRWLLALALSPAPAFLRAGVGLSLLNLLLTAVLGGAIAADRDHPLLPAGHLQALYAHAHLAGVGFAGCLVVAVGLRLLPMFLPAAAPRGSLPWLAVLGTGLGGTSFGLLGPLLPQALPWLSLPPAVGLATFLGLVLGMLRQPKPPPRDLPRPDPLRVLQLVAVLALLLAVALGLYLAFASAPAPAHRTLYGFTFLGGCLGSLILAMQLRLLPLCAWHAARRGLPDLQLPPPPNRSWSVPMAWAMVGLWCGGLAAGAVALLGDSLLYGRFAGLLLGGGAVAAAANLRRSWKHVLNVG